MPAASALEVLVVDDQRAMRSLVIDSLRHFGVSKIVECGDGKEALQELLTRPRHMVISDLNMPVMDGLQLLEAVRKDPGLKTLAFIMLTSRGEVELVKKAVALGVNNYLMKPFSADGLRKKIEAVVGPLT